ncbi:MAG: CDP-diacylglycerol--serine O-phosphatidyltransferase [Archangium gephyra]|uniref:CDP-diacylglycerol--serine O-phosphatidyltransferase n=1 Tax=Archangium gephyra TaxID=48 RepID=A0A2W5T5E9_9BACT|nr:MAG: CDP-diacylglycerol--serine O-phosphatidyltransferase [Archangium gephyra]
MKLRDLMFVLPNLFTVSSILCGFYAMTLCTGDATPTHLYQGALAIFFGMFFDAFDGRVARLTKTQSMFGQELDSLADVITFGAAPALLVWKWALSGLGLVGLVAAFLYASCGALRLARFNVLAIRSPHGGGGSFFVGMPIPFAACGVISMIIAHEHARGGTIPEAARWPVLGVVLFLGALMVSTVRYRTFKDAKPNPKTFAILAAVIVTGVIIGVLSHPAWVLVAYFGLYLLSGLVESAFMLRKYLVGKRAATGSIADVIDEDEDDEEDTSDDQEVL